MRARTIAILFALVLLIMIARNYRNIPDDNKSGLHATICRMTNDSSKNNEKIKNGMLLRYEYDLIWCDEDRAMKLVEDALSSNDTKKVVFMIGGQGSTKRERKQYWISNSKMHIRAKMNDKSFDDGLFDYNLMNESKDEIEAVLMKKYPNYQLMRYNTMAIHNDWSDVYDQNWRIITDEVALKHYLGDERESFDSDLMVFVRNDATNQSIVLLSDIHCSPKMGQIQNKFIQEWKPSAASLELDLWLWRFINDNKDKEHSDLSLSLLNYEKGCVALAAVCGALGYKSEGKCMKIAAATGMSGLCAAGKCCNTISKRLDYMFKCTNMMSVLENQIPKTIFLSEWFYASSSDGGRLDILETKLKELEENDNETTASLASYALKGAAFCLMDSVKDYAEWAKESSEQITVKVRSDIMFQSLMSLARLSNHDDGSRKHNKIVGVYGAEHLKDIKTRFEGNSDGFLLQLNE